MRRCRVSTQQLHSREFIVDVVTETRRVDDGEGDTNTLLFELYNILSGPRVCKTRGTVRTDVDGLDSDALLDVGRFRAIRLFVGKYVRFAEGVHKGCAPSARSTYKTEIPVVRQ